MTWTMLDSSTTTLNVETHTEANTLVFYYSLSLKVFKKRYKLLFDLGRQRDITARSVIFSVYIESIS